jgi:hypothetical protein
MRAVSKQPTGRDHIDAAYLEGLAAGLYFWKLLEKDDPNAGAMFIGDCKSIAKQMGLTLDEIDLSTVEIIPPPKDE